MYVFQIVNFSFIDLAPIFLQIAIVLSFIYFPCSFLFKKKIKILTLGIFLLISCAFIILIYAHIFNKFILANVYYNSHTSKPLLYKIFGVWGNHEGSVLLWIWIMVLYSVFLEFFLNNNRIKVISLSIQNLLVGLFLIFCVFSSNPFVKMSEVFINGLGFNPILQDFALTIHPPTLYLGYVGFSAVFSISLASLLARIDPIEWSIAIKAWSMVGWLFLTLGIGLGSWWAYRELGWGGFWFWDPVENSSLIPWLLSTAFVHSRLIVEKSGKFFNLAVILSIFTFIFSLIATFLVRSGLLISVHTFANDSDRGFYLLLLISIVIIGSFFIYAFFSLREIKPTCNIGFFSKAMFLLFSNVIFITAFFIILVGTFYPIILEFFTNAVIAVGEPYYIFFFRVLTIIALALMIIVLKISWHRDTSLLKIAYKYRIPFLISLITSIFLNTKDYIALMIFFLAEFLFISIIEDFFYRRLFLKNKLKIKRSISKSYYSMIFSHIGLVLLIVGIICSTTWQIKKELYMKEGDNVILNDFNITFSKILFVKNTNYDSLKGIFIISNSHGKILGKVMPESRVYLVERTRNAESSIYRNFLSDIYVLIGDMNEDMRIAVCIYYKPYINLIWLGVLCMVIGGMISIFFRYFEKLIKYYRINT